MFYHQNHFLCISKMQKAQWWVTLINQLFFRLNSISFSSLGGHVLNMVNCNWRFQNRFYFDRRQRKNFWDYRNSFVLIGKLTFTAFQRAQKTFCSPKSFCAIADRNQTIFKSRNAVNHVQHALPHLTFKVTKENLKVMLAMFRVQCPILVF